MKVFDPINTPLTGTNLIEASAGTGKTYAIAGLFLRLILEKQLTANQILVVTFSKAATEELKERIWNKLLSAKSAFLKGSSKDVLIDTFVKQYDHPLLAVRLIQDALIDFDHAAIFTIHGFCQRILHEHAFETHSLFDTELVTDSTALKQEVAEDFWRKYFYRMPLEFMGYFLNKLSGPKFFLDLLTNKMSFPVNIIPDIEKPELKSLHDFRTIFKKLKADWPISRDQIIQLLKDPSLSGTIYGSLTTKTLPTDISKRDLMILSMIASMDRFVDEKSSGFPLFKGFEKFTATKIEHATRKNYTPPVHELFDICDVLYSKGLALGMEMDTYLLYLKSLFFRFFRTQLDARKKRSNVQFYDDLLLKVKNALEDKGGNKLVSAIRQKYRAALVDEFQDTDPIQYQIFTRLFTSDENPLFMIGDPKQAIYSFRGADIFSYMKAARNVDSKYTLIANWRSDPGLITAVNTLFTNRYSPFVFDKIGFEKAVPGEKNRSNRKTSVTPLTLWYIDSYKNTADSKRPNKAEVIPIISRAVSSEILRLISKGKGEQSDSASNAVNPGDIAVLVRTNRQAQIIKQNLSSLRIPSVLYNTGNIFHTHEAMEMERILLSIAEPSNKRRFISALVTDIMGVSGQELDSAGMKTLWLDTKSDKFREYSRLWSRYGFIRMFRMLMSEEKVRERLLGFPDGERRLTNLLHLTELLHQESIEKKAGMTALLKWLSEQRNASVLESETHQLRLESDVHAVKIITIHKSKGLEYPVVFCPFSWDGSLIKNREILFHDSERNDDLTLDLGSKEIHVHLAQAQNELLAENLRLLYVALTRATKRCYLVWGRFNTAETSALAYLLHYQNKTEGMNNKEDLITSLKTSFSAKNNTDFLKDLKQLSRRSGGTIEAIPLPIDNGLEYLKDESQRGNLSCRQFSGNIDTSWKISSYSCLISQRKPDEELPDHDVYHDYRTAMTEIDLKLCENTDIFSFPKGVRSGIFFHDIFEHLNFTGENAEHKIELIKEKLQVYGFESKWQSAVSRTIDNVLSIPLETKKNGLRLSAVPCSHRINEMEFYFPLKPVTPHRLEKIFARYADIEISENFPNRLEKLNFSFPRGFLKGYIDMVFHDKGRFFIVDWKSNFLGPRVEDYGKDILNKVMIDEFYILQYHLYTLGLYKYLQMRMPKFSYERDFGGVFYIFIRGVDPKKGPEFGIYKDLPNINLVNALLKALIPGH